MKECENCQADNDDSAMYCERCDAPFKDLMNLSSSDTTNYPILKLIDKKIKKEIEIKQSCLLGREGDIEASYFSKSEHVSRKHCNIILDKNEFKIEHLSNVTPTKVNNQEIGKGFKQVIRNGDTLTIADLEFNVSIIKKENNSINNSSEVTKILKKTYIITCPKCGKKYEVIDKNQKINECDECDDYDKEEIAKISAEEVIENAN